jgi:hypothetical protein
MSLRDHPIAVIVLPPGVRCEDVEFDSVIEEAGPSPESEARRIAEEKGLKATVFIRKTASNLDCVICETQTK